MTTLPSDDNFVSGYDFHSNCLWPVFTEILSSELAFVFGLSNLPIFKANYSKMKMFLDRTGHDRSILGLFNLSSFANLLCLEFQDLINDQKEESNARIIGKYCIQILEDYYLNEIGDKLIRLAVQIIIYRLNVVIEKINS